MDLSQEIKRKTQQLIFLKSNYNAQVEDIDKEISLKKQIIDEMVIHFPLSLARQCLSLLRKNPPDNNISFRGDLSPWAQPPAFPPPRLF